MTAADSVSKYQFHRTIIPGRSTNYHVYKDYQEVGDVRHSPRR